MKDLQSIFEKPVGRHIEGVIKADDESHLRHELEEYVLTKEIQRRLGQFLSAYNDYAGANGVWVSGFFGSGKSHLLKMLALVLENRAIGDTTAYELFKSKIDATQDAVLAAELRKAVKTPSKSILFNIDQKADVISKEEFDALLTVFVKVFDEMCGYYGKQGHIAQFERDLDSRGRYNTFKEAFEQIAQIPWERGREQAILEGENIASAYAQTMGTNAENAKNIIDKYREDYRVSIEDFAEQVHDYIQTQEKGFRLNFFVDEVGQYIADNVKLMTNLQTIAESLATKCQGQAWIIVTAQEDMGEVVGDMGKKKGNDFSKIQDRFKTRMKLTSTNVEEVIQERLLLKNDHGVVALQALYDEQKNNLRTLFGFSDGARTYKNYESEEEFVRTYPFVPYQFTLFQSAIRSLSQHNAFEGRHSSVGERSMLGVFRQVAIKIEQQQIGELATFDLMYEGIRNALKSEIQSQIFEAERHLDHEFAIKILKTLFLVKYVKDFKATVPNLTVLMLDAFDRNVQQLSKDITNALRLLESQTFIQRHGNEYEYLTDQEKDVEKEIKNTEVETSEVTRALQDIIFNQILTDRRIRYNDGLQDYPYTRKLDDQVHSTEQELAIHVLSLFHENADKQHTVFERNLGTKELLVVMEQDPDVAKDLLMYLRTEKYIRQNPAAAQREEVQRILREKGQQNHERRQVLVQQITERLGAAKLVVNGTPLEVSTREARSRITEGFQSLVAVTYPNLKMLPEVSYKEDDILPILTKAQTSLLEDDTAHLSEAEAEILAAIAREEAQSLRVSVKSLVDRFEKAPYGWPYAATLCLIARLCANGHVEARMDGQLCEHAVLAGALTRRKQHANIILRPQIKFSAKQVRELQEFYQDFFDEAANNASSKELAQKVNARLSTLLRTLKDYRAQDEKYPFLKALDEAIEKIAPVVAKPYEWYLQELPAFHDTLLDLKDDLLEPIKAFMEGSQRRVYDDAFRFNQQHQHDFSYIDSQAVDRFKTALQAPDIFRGNRVNTLKTMVETLRDTLAQEVQNERNKAHQSIEEYQRKFTASDEFQALSPEHQSEIRNDIQRILSALHEETLIAKIRERANTFMSNTVPALHTKIMGWSTRTSKVEVTAGPTSESVPYDVAPQVVHRRTIHVNPTKLRLEDEQDVDDYLKALREAYLKTLQSGKHILV